MHLWWSREQPWGSTCSTAASSVHQWWARSSVHISRQRYHLGRHTPILLAVEVPHDGKSDSDTHLTPSISLYSDPSEPSYTSYHVESDPSEPSRPSVIRLTSDLSSSSAASRHMPPLVRGRGFIHTCAVPRGRGRARRGGCGDVASCGFKNGFCPPDEWCGDCMQSTRIALLFVVIGLSFYCMACLGFRDFWCISFMMYSVRFLL